MVVYITPVLAMQFFKPNKVKWSKLQKIIISTAIGWYNSLDIRTSLTDLLHVLATVYAEWNPAAPCSQKQTKKPAPCNTARRRPQNIVCVLIAVWTFGTALLVKSNDGGTLLLRHHHRMHHGYAHSHHWLIHLWTHLHTLGAHHCVHSHANSHVGRRLVHRYWGEKWLTVVYWLSVHTLGI
jgi:hypothetical protein